MAHPSCLLPPRRISFTCLGEKADTSINVFGQEFQVHSRILKMHSTFFRRFMETTTPPQLDQPGIIYHYAAKVERDGVWGVQPITKIDCLPMDNFPCSEKDKAIDAFRCLLDAMYLKRGAVGSLDSLHDLFTMGDYYLAMPIVSAYVNLNLLESTAITTRIELHPTQILQLATKLRSVPLFRESFIHIVGQWNTWTLAQRTEVKHQLVKLSPRVYDLVLIHHGKLREKVAKALWMLQSYLLCCEDVKNAWFANMVAEIILSLRRKESGRTTNTNVRTMSEPDFFKRIYTSLLEFRDNDKAFTDTQHSRRSVSMLQRGLMHDLGVVEELLRNNLVFGGTNRNGATSGRGKLRYLVCTQLDNEEFPWDVNETDW